MQILISELAQQETDLIKSGRLSQSKDLAQKLGTHKASAASIFRQDARINLRLSSKDLRALQTRALQDGIPYPTL